jgi:hypothetical protein
MLEGRPRRMSSQARASGDRTCELGIMCTKRVVCNIFWIPDIFGRLIFKTVVCDILILICGLFVCLSLSLYIYMCVCVYVYIYIYALLVTQKSKK